ncbi:DUF423 domain-containing protein [Paenibacillus wulumuqiensis]|uniref:DUF423 domain-containing protein n=1 Tax=Paenibacillus wulumuqiensis TaxID=1567107 RepID=UPI000619B353|nr:DUF423 domain-containing protein [Paenibacillus wulumuqiensis]
MQSILVIGSIMMFLAVALGAFGAHALKAKLSPDMMKIYETGIQYHIAHSLGMLIIGALSPNFLNGQSLAIAAGWCLFVGIILFSGSLYALSLSGIRKLGAITPLGGLLFLAGWVLLLISVLS